MVELRGYGSFTIYCWDSVAGILLEQNDDVSFHYLFPQKVSLPNLKVLKLAELENLERLGDDPLLAGSLSQLKKISMRDCGRLLCVIPSQLLMMLRDLEKLKVKCCNLLEVVLEFEGVEYNEPNPEILPPLELVKLSDLPKLNYISKRDPTSFKYIQDLDIDNCYRLRYIFSPTMTKSIPQLRELKIWRCEMLSRIIAEENELGESTVDEVEFPQLRTVELRDLPNLVSFFPNVNTTSMAKSTDHYRNLLQPQPLFNEKVAIPSLERLELRGLENVSDLWSNELLISSFSKLKNLKVSDCSILEAVVGKEEQVQGHGREIVKTIFPELGKLKLRSLPNLRRFCHFMHPLEIPMLRKVDILDCPNMDAFSLEPVSTPNLGTGDLNYGIPLLKEISRQKENRVKEALNWFKEFLNSIEEKVKKDVDVDEDQEETENRRKEQEHQRKEDGTGTEMGTRTRRRRRTWMRTRKRRIKRKRGKRRRRQRKRAENGNGLIWMRKGRIKRDFKKKEKTIRSY
ncbi:hypothetical protein Vadar_007475 [Vaccinium darrowii]|uniref:Uncharacterized protein n=1 Tax=Vaccinium darrowii TaxID=229202 RepID=A0ACB7XNX5_9ERIC|nr:hypothetical protein Vadar_007475 [Vaccinium darrowii]